jgi:hypothetical protein
MFGFLKWLAATIAILSGPRLRMQRRTADASPSDLVAAKVFGFIRLNNFSEYPIFGAAYRLFFERNSASPGEG